MGFGHSLVSAVSRYLTRHDEAPHPNHLSDFDRVCHEVRLADVLLVEGHSRASKIIRRITHSPWTHAALYIGRLHDIEDPTIRELVHKHYQGPIRDQLLIEAIVGKNTIISSIEKYKDEHIRICRPTGLSHNDAQKIIAHAAQSIGGEYNIRHFIDLGRFLLSSRFIPRSWRSSLFERSSGRATQDICSSMIAAAFTAVKFPILPLVREDEERNFEFIRRNPKLFTPSDFDYSPYFDIVKYPMFSFKGSAPYHHLPWKTGLYSNDDAGIVETSKKTPTSDNDTKQDNDSEIEAGEK